MKLIFHKILKFSTESTSKNIIETSKNLINPSSTDPVAFGYYFPK